MCDGGPLDGQEQEGKGVKGCMLVRSFITWWLLSGDNGRFLEPAWGKNTAYHAFCMTMLW